MNDKLVYDLSLETEGVPNVFIRKDWLNILDNQNGNYQGNQSVIDTSQISNANKFMNYREAYLAIPLLLSVEATANAGNDVNIGVGGVGLKNWFGQIIHSFNLDYNGSTVIQQTNFINMWNSFKLLTSLNYDDIELHGATIGFYPDIPDAFEYSVDGAIGIGNSNCDVSEILNVGNFQNQLVAAPANINGNTGLQRRIKNINFLTSVANTYDNYTTNERFASMWLSNVSSRNAAAVELPLMQVSVMAVVYLKHLSSFFNFVPLLKGAFMKITMSFNSGTSTVTADSVNFRTYDNVNTTGGTNPLLIPSHRTGSNWIANIGGAGANAITLKYNISVGNRCLDNQMPLARNELGNVASNIYLYVPAYSFNPTFYDAYIASSPKRVVYTDVYQYQVPRIQTPSFNTLISNGISNIKSVLVIPFLATNLKNTVAPNNVEVVYPQWQSPFDTAGSGTTAPFALIKNFQVQISGQNAVYNNQQYSFEEFNNQLLGCNGVNGGLLDGVTSGLIDFQGFKNSYCYYYVNVERMLPSEKNVPKSVQISGIIQHAKDLELMVFVEYENSMKFDLQTGARVA